VLGGHSFIAWCSFMLACWHSGLSFVGAGVGWDSPLLFLHPRPTLHCRHHSTCDPPQKQLLVRLGVGGALLSIVCCLSFVIHCLLSIVCCLLYLSFVVCHLLFVVCHLLFIIHCLSFIIHCSLSVVPGVSFIPLSAPTYPPCEQWLAAAGVGAGVGWCQWWPWPWPCPCPCPCPYPLYLDFLLVMKWNDKRKKKYQLWPKRRHDDVSWLLLGPLLPLYLTLLLPVSTS
jgi:hypothetical protein